MKSAFVIIAAISLSFLVALPACNHAVDSGAGLAGESTPDLTQPATTEVNQPAQTQIDADTTTLTVYGMSCPLCATNVDKQLLKVPGVKGVDVNLDSGRILVTVSRENPPSKEQLAAAVEDSGFTLIRIEE